MGALLLALLPLIEGLVEGESLDAIFAAFTVAQWTTLASDILNIAEPALSGALKTKLAALRPSLATFVVDIESGKPVDLVATAIFDLYSAKRQAPTIPGYAGDGSVKEIPNPDYKPGE